METMKVKWIGTRPMLMHNERLADPLNEHAKALASLTSAKGAATKTEAHCAEKSRVEWEGGLYYDDETGPYVPAWNILACIKEGARMKKRGKEVDRAVEILDIDRVPLLYDGPRDLEGMWSAGLYLRVGVTSGGGGRVQRTRPQFPRWSLAFDLVFDPSRFSRDGLVESMADAGMYVGIGDWRPSSPKKGGRYGKFRVEAS